MVKTYGELTRSTEEEFKAFRKSLDRLKFSPQQLADYIDELVEKQKKDDDTHSQIEET